MIEVDNLVKHYAHTKAVDGVEEICDRILLINHGRVVLYGSLEQI